MNDRVADVPSATTAATAPTTSSSRGGHVGTETNIKETVEQILVAFILAFIFRAFVVEAFVIPTGSMAPTLLGAHMRFHCDDCGYDWDVNFPTIDRDDITIPAWAGPVPVVRNGVLDHTEDYVFNIRCPNCGYKIQRRDPDDPHNAATNPPVYYGDRILVLKYLYLFQEPRRWDVVVFKSPDDPQRFDYGQNYIKRLVGKPGETVMILDGDIYTSTADKPTAELTPGDFQIQRKAPRAVQEALWRIVYDNDFYPHNAAPSRTGQFDPTSRIERDELWVQPWKPTAASTGWDLGGDPVSGKIFRFDNLAGAGTIRFDQTANPQKQSLTDWLGYDATANQGPNGAAYDKFDEPLLTAENNVSDVKLQFFYQRNDGSGPLRLTLTKLDHTFVAELSPGKASLYQQVGQGPATLIRTVDLSNDFARPTRLEFTNVDYRVSLGVDDREVIATTPAEYSPDVAALLGEFQKGDRDRTYRLPPPTVAISAEKQSCSIAHLSLWRDIYYMSRAQGGGPLRWATPAQFPIGLTDSRGGTRAGLVRLGPDEFFVCGDNSLISGDARYWGEPINLPNEDLVVQSGRVPRRFMLGKAFFVYWPAGYRPVDAAPALVPNFGAMRFIH